MKTKYIYTLALCLILLQITIPAFAFSEDYIPSENTLQALENSSRFADPGKKTHAYNSDATQPISMYMLMQRSGGGSDDTIDPNDPNWNDPNTGNGDGISVISPVGDLPLIILLVVFIYMAIGLVRNRQRKQKEKAC